MPASVKVTALVQPVDKRPELADSHRI
jgi:hypothetical protein